MSYIKRIVSDPGVIFPWGNIFAMIQSGNIVSTLITAGTAVLATTSKAIEVYVKDPVNARSGLTRLVNTVASRTPKFVQNQFSSLRIAGIGILAAGLTTGISAIATGSLVDVILPVVAAGSFAAGDVLLSSPLATKVQATLRKGWKKAATHAGAYFGIGYVATGLMAGGGLSLFHNLAAHVPALVTTGVGVTTTTLTTIGIVSGRWKTAKPYAFLSGGSIINTISGVLSGNIFGAINSLFSATGEGRIYQLVNNDSRKAAVAVRDKDPTEIHKKSVRPVAKSKFVVRPVVRLVPAVSSKESALEKSKTSTPNTQKKISEPRKKSNRTRTYNGM